MKPIRAGWFFLGLALTAGAADWTITGFTGNGGPARTATLSGPKGIALDRDGNIWLADTESHTVRRIDGRTGRIELIAGTGAKGNGADGDPRQCALARLHGIFADSDGAIYLGDSEAHRVRVLRQRKCCGRIAAVPPPSFKVTKFRWG